MEMKLTVAHSRLPSLLLQSVENGNWQRERDKKENYIFFTHFYCTKSNIKFKSSSYYYPARDNLI